MAPTVGASSPLNWPAGRGRLHLPIMKKGWLAVVAVLVAGAVALTHHGQPGAPPSPPIVRGLPLAFEPNRGQALADADYVARGRGYTILVGKDGVTLEV